MTNNRQSVIDAIKIHTTFLVTTHVNPEGDALGSLLAVTGLLEALGKKVVMVHAEPVPELLCFLPGVDHIITSEAPNVPPCDAAVLVDCATLERCGSVKSLVQSIPKVINIDHHTSNVMFGDANWVNENASSTGEMIYELFAELGVDITPEIALDLYVSIVTDTGSFSYTNTTAATHAVIKDLLSHGICPEEVYRQLHQNLTHNDVRLLQRVLATLCVTGNGKVAYLTLKDSDIKETGSRITETEFFIKYARWIQGVEVSLLFKEIPEKNEIKVSFRSNGEVDVNALAGRFGGGGHVRAAGATLSGITLDDAQRQVLGEIGNL